MNNHSCFALGSQLLLGKYSLDNNRLRPTDDKGQIIHIRERANPKGNSRYFLAWHNPTFRYISNLWPASTVEGSLKIVSSIDPNFTGSVDNIDFSQLKLCDFDNWYFEYNNTKFQLTIDDTEATITLNNGGRA